jgi:hypothetical protein
LKGRDVQEVEKKDMLAPPAGPPVSLGTGPEHVAPLLA